MKESGLRNSGCYILGKNNMHWFEDDFEFRIKNFVANYISYEMYFNFIFSKEN